MKVIIIVMLALLLGFFGYSLLVDVPGLIVDKSMFFFFGVLIASVLLAIKDFR